MAPSKPLDSLVGVRFTTDWTIDLDSTTLELRISNGASIRASEDPDYEAWEVHTRTGELIVALVAGKSGPSSREEQLLAEIAELGGRLDFMCGIRAHQGRP